MDDLPIIEMPSGVKVSATTKTHVDWAAAKTLYEFGVGCTEIAAQLKVNVRDVQAKRKQEGWISPTKLRSLQKEIAVKQRDILKASGKALEPANIKAQIWEERAEAIKEKTYDIVRSALEGVSPEKAKKLIQNPLGLAHITTVARQITGEEAKEAKEQPRMFVNIGFLSPVDAPTTVDV